MGLALLLVSMLGISGVLWQWRVALAERNHALEKEQTAREAVLVALEAEEGARKARDNETEARRRAEASLYSSNLARSRLEFERNDADGALRVLDRCPEELRGWEWHFQRQLCQAALTDVNARHSHAGWIQGLAYSPDGNTLLTAGGGNPFFATQGAGSEVPGEIKCWDTHSATEQTPLGPLRHLPFWVGWSRDGSKVASLSADHLLQVWNMPDRKLARAIPNVSWNIETYRAPVTFVGDGQEILLVETSRQMVSYDSRTGTRRELGIQSQGPRVLAADKRGQRLALTERWGTGNGINVWNRDGARRIPLEAVLGDYVDVVLSDDGKLVAATCGNTIQVWNLSDTAGSLRYTLAGHQATVLCIAISPDQRYLASGSADSTVNLWNLLTGELVGRFRQHSRQVTGVAFHPSGDRLASCGRDGKWLEWDLTADLANGSVAVVPFVSRTNPEAIALTPDGQMMIMGRGGFLQQLDLRTQWTTDKHQVDLLGAWFTPAQVAHFDRAGKRVAGIAGSDRQHAKVWEVATSRELLTVPPQPGTLRHVILSGNGLRLVASAGLGVGQNRHIVEIQGWDIEETRKIFQLSRDDAYVLRLAVDHAGDSLALGLVERISSLDQPYRATVALEVYSLASGKRVHRDEKLSSLPSALGFDRTGKLVAVTGNVPNTTQMRTRIVDWEKGTYREGTEAPPQPSTLDFSPDGKRLAIFGRIRGGVLDTETLEEVVPLHGRAQLTPNNRAFNPEVRFSDDGRTLAAICDDGSACLAIWSVPAPGSVATDRAERQEARERKLLCWHFHEGNHALNTGNTEGFLFHARKLREGLPRFPEPSPLQWALVTRYGLCQLWQDASAIYADLLRDNPGFVEPLPHAGAVLLLRTNEMPNYRLARQRWLRRAETATDPQTAIINAWAATLGPEPAKDLDGISRQLRSLPPDRVGNGLISQYHHALGRIHYRGERYAEAIKSLEESNRHRQHWPFAEQNQPLLAMSLHRLGQSDAARAALAKALEAEAKIRAQRPPEFANPWRSSWYDWLSLELLCRQAEAVLALPPPKGS